MGSGTKGGKEFLLDNLVVAVTQVLLKLRGLLALPLIVKTLGTAGYGLWAQLLSVITFGGAIVGANLHLPLIRFIAGKTAPAPRVYSSTVACTLLLGSLGAVALVLASGRLSVLLLGGAEHAPLLEASALLIVLHNVRTLNVSLYRATNRFIVRSVVEFATAMLELGGILLVLRAGYGLREVVLFMVVWNAVVVVATTVHALAIVGFATPTLDVANQAVRYGASLVPGAVAYWAMERSDRLVIGHQLGPTHVGVYSAAYALGFLVLHYQLPFQMTLLPRVAELWDTDRARAKRYIELSTKVFLALAIPTVVGMPMVAPIALHSLANDEIARGSGVLAAIIGVGGVFQGLAIMQTQIFHGAKRTTATSVAMIVAAVINIGSTFALVPRFGIMGAGFATLVGYLALLAMLVVMARPLMRVDHQIGFILKSVAAAGLMAGLLWAIHPTRLVVLLLSLVPAVALYFTALWLLRALSADERTILRNLLARKRPPVESS